MSTTPPTSREQMPDEEAERDDQAPGAGGTEPKGRRWGKFFVSGSLLFVCLLWLIPTMGLLISSLREEDLVKTTGWWTVLASPLDFTQWTLENYSEVLSAGMANAFLNSFVVSIPAVIIPILSAAFAAYAFAWMRFPGRETLFIMLIALLVVPLQVAFIPLLQLYGNMGLTGTFPAVWLAHTGFAMPLAVYLLRNYMGSLPREVIESAEVDGASHFQIFWRLMIPLSTPVLAAFAILQFLWVWNDFLIALIFLGSNTENQVVTLAMNRLIGSRGEEWHLLTAGGFIIISVPLLVFFALQRYFVRGLTAGSVKG
ncbi:MAG: carbohydrate ABC transporter permease [Egibacteraceae bacterium]